MKTYKNLFAQIVSFQNLLEASHKAAKGKRDRPNVLIFFSRMEDDLLTPVTRRKGLPIGNLTSQFLANLYLTPFDHFVKEHLRCIPYLRYVDDFALFSDSKGQLHQWRSDMGHFLASHRLRLHPRRVQMAPSHVGSRFLGQVVYRSHRRLTGENVRRLRRHLRVWERHPPDNLRQRIASWIGHAGQADARALLRSVLSAP